LTLTPRQLRRLVRAIAYRERLCEELPELKAELLSYALENDLRRVAGYEIELYDMDLRLRKLDYDHPPLDQLKLELDWGEEYR
jgi:hypothetical protein